MFKLNDLGSRVSTPTLGNGLIVGIGPTVSRVSALEDPGRGLAEEWRRGSLLDKGQQLEREGACRDRIDQGITNLAGEKRWSMRVEDPPRSLWRLKARQRRCKGRLHGRAKGGRALDVEICLHWCTIVVSFWLND